MSGSSSLIPDERYVVNDRRIEEGFSNIQRQEYVDSWMPEGTTCSFELAIPDYSTYEVMKEKLLMAIKVCVDFNTDGINDRADSQLSEQSWGGAGGHSDGGEGENDYEGESCDSRSEDTYNMEEQDRSDGYDSYGGEDDSSRGSGHECPYYGSDKEEETKQDSK